MENIIGWLLIAAVLAAPVLALIWLFRWKQKTEQDLKDQVSYFESQLVAAQEREQERWRQDRVKTGPARPVPSTVSGGGGGGTSYTYSNSRLRDATPLPLAQESDNSALRDLALLYAVNSMVTTTSAAEPTAAIGRSTEDDRVVRDSFSSSDSSSSWSSDSSSSSSDVSSDW